MEISKYATVPVFPDSLYFLDIDDTIIRADRTLVDPGIHDWLRKVRAAGSKVYGLTARAALTADATALDLAGAGVSFDEPDFTSAIFQRKGCFFTDFAIMQILKGTILKRILNDHGSYYNQVIFVDDLLENTDDVERKLPSVRVYRMKGPGDWISVQVDIDGKKDTWWYHTGQKVWQILLSPDARVVRLGVGTE